MNNRSKLLLAAVTSLVAMTAVQAAEPPTTEKCFGVAKAGKNDCATGKHTCMTLSKVDNDGDAWVNLPKGTCEKLVGGSLTAK